jgi:hypothetical protein
MDPITIGLLSSGVGSLIGGIGANKQAQEAARREKINSLLGAQDTRFSPFVAGQTKKLAEMEAGPGLLGGALSGAVAGFQQGQKIKGLGVAKDGFQKLQDATKKGADLAGQSYGVQNPYQMMGQPQRYNPLQDPREPIV